MLPANTEPISSFDYSCGCLESDTMHYVQLEFKVPKSAAANLTYTHLQQLADQFEKGLHR